MFITAILLSLLSFSGCAKRSYTTHPIPTSKKGILDLTKWNFKNDGVIKLDGEWEFYWQTFQSHSHTKPDNEAMTGYIFVPGSWNKYNIYGKILSGNGYATYCLRIKIGETSENLSLKIPRIFTAYSLFINGKLLTSAGKVAKSGDDMTPVYYPKIVMINTDSEEIHLVINVSNFNHRSGGILESIKIGTESQIIKAREDQLALELFLFGCLLIMGVYHLVLFLFRRKNLSPLYFGLYCILIAIRTIFTGEIFIVQLLPNINWEIQHKIQTLTFYAGVPVFVMFLKSIFPKEFPNKALRFSQITGSLFCLLVLFAPVRVFSIFNPVYQIVTSIVIVFTVYTFILACIRKRQGSVLLTLGGIFFVLTAINDILFLSIPFNDYDISFLRNIIVTGNLSSFGLIVLVFTQSAVIAANFSRTFTQVEVMSEKLMISDCEKNELLSSLEDIVRERTIELEESNRQLNEAYHNLSQMEKTRNNLFSNISHDLKTPMTLIQGYTEAMLDGMIISEDDQQKYLELIQSKIISLSNLTNGIIELTKMESRLIKLDLQSVNIQYLMTQIDNKFRYDVEAKGLKFILKMPDDVDKFYLNIDLNKIWRVFSNLIFNAIKHTRQGKITVTCKISDEYTEFTVADTGTGVSQSDISSIFERFYSESKSRNSSSSGSGLGLAIAKEIVEYHEGKIWVENNSDRGASFIFTVKR